MTGLIQRAYSENEEDSKYSENGTKNEELCENDQNSKETCGSEVRVAIEIDDASWENLLALVDSGSSKM